MKKEVVLRIEESCRSLTLFSTWNKTDLVSNQEEADTNFLHADRLLRERSSNNIGDTDIVLLGASFFSLSPSVYIENSTGKKVLWLGAFELSRSHREVLIGFHAFTGNNHCIVLHKRKETCMENFNKSKQI